MTVTPSQIDKARDCIRRVAWDFVDPQQFVQRPEAALGDEVHDMLELYSKCGATPDKTELAGQLALLALPYAPRPRTGMSEGFVQWTPKRMPGVTFSMRVDWCGKTDELEGMPAVAQAMPATVDYKTSKDPSYGVWGEEAHYQNVQSLVYAEHRLEVTSADAVYNRWLYIRTPEKKRPAAMPSDQVMERARVHAAMDRLVYPIALKLESMKRDAAGKRLNVFDLPPNPRQCNKYAKRDGSGGCPRQAQCNLTAAETMDAIEGEDRYMDKLLEMLGAPKPVETAPAPVSINPAPSQPAAADPLLAVLEGAPAPADQYANVVTPEAAPAPSTRVELNSKPAVSAADAVAVVDASIAGVRPSDEDIGRVVRFLFGK